VTPYSEPEGGGLERYAHAILSRLARQGHDVSCFAFTRGEPGARERDGVRLRLLRPLVRVGNAPVHPAFAHHVRRAIQRERPDVVVAHTPVPFPAEMAYRAARAERVPFVATYHAGRLRGSSPLLDGLASVDRATLEKRMLAGSRRLIAVSPYVRDHALGRQRDRVAVIPPGVDHARYRPGGSPDPAAILFVGPLDRSYRWKGLDALWEAFHAVRRRHPHATLTLVGTGDRHAEFTAHAEADPAIRVLRRLPDEQIIGEYRRASALVLPSLTDAESFGMVLAEANACGTPVVGSDVGGIPSFVRHGDNGLLARPGDPDDLAAKLLRLFDDPREARAMGRRGRERVVREHDWDDLARRTAAVLEDAVVAPAIPA
jgi:glycosyltransferase involved in cell wall biosynthesis